MGFKEKIKKVASRLKKSWNSPVSRKFRKNRLALVGMVIVAGVVFTVIFAPLIAPYHWNERFDVDGDGKLDYDPHGPTSEHILGTDHRGRDILSRIIYASRLDLMLGLLLVGTSASIGVLLGLIAGFYGGRIESLIMRAADATLAFPDLVLAVAIAGILLSGGAAGGGSLIPIILVLGLLGWAGYGRLVRGQVLAVKTRDFVEAAEAFGEKKRTIMFRYVFPHTFAPIIVFMTTGLPAALLIAAALSFLGLGVAPPTAEWGLMLGNAREFLPIYPVWATSVGLAIMITVLGFNFLGDGLRDALDPRIKSY